MSKRLMPTYLIKFLENLYTGNKPLDFTRVMVTRQFIAKLKELYVTLGGNQPENYTQVLVPKYLQDFFNELEIIEFDDDDISQTKTVPSNLVYPACRIDSIGFMSYKCYQLLDENGSYENGVFDPSGNIVSNPNWKVYTDYIELSQNQITLSYIFTSRGQFNIAQYDSSKTFISTLTYDVNSYTPFIPNLDSNCKYIRISYRSELMTNIMVNYGTTALPYQPFFTGLRDSVITSVKSYDSNNNLIDTYTIPSEIQALEGYGQGINSTVYNNVDFASGKYVKKVGVIDLGTLTYTYYSGAATPVFFATKPSDAKIETGGLSALYEPLRDFWTTSGNDMKQWISTNNLNISNSNYNNAASFKAAMNGVLFYYEVNKPVETTITEQAPLLEVEEGGTIVLENEYNQDVPSEVVTWIKEN